MADQVPKRDVDQEQNITPTNVGENPAEQGQAQENVCEDDAHNQEPEVKVPDGDQVQAAAGPSQTPGQAQQTQAGQSANRPIQQRRMESIQEAMQMTLSTWPELHAEGRVLTEDFLLCANVVVQFVESLGVTFAPVASDIRGNIQKLMASYLKNRQRNKYLQDVVDFELRSGDGRSDTETLIWLLRGLDFLCTFLESLVRDYEARHEPENLNRNLRESYEATLYRHHGWILKQLFVFLSAATPNRTTLMQRLAANVGLRYDENFIGELRRFNIGLRGNLNALFDFYRRRNLHY